MRRPCAQLWESNNDEDDDEYEDCCETDDARSTSSMHVCISRQQSWNCIIISKRIPVHIIGYIGLFLLTRIIGWYSEVGLHSKSTYNREYAVLLYTYIKMSCRGKTTYYTRKKSILCE